MTPTSVSDRLADVGGARWVDATGINPSAFTLAVDKDGVRSLSLLVRWCSIEYRLESESDRF